MNVDLNEVRAELNRLQRRLDGEAAEPLNYGEFVERLRDAIARAKRGDDEYLSFDWGSAYPSTIDSYRGYYEHVGIGFDGSHGGCKAGDFLKKLEDALHTDMTGWKGGEYTIHDRCEVWVACNGCTSRTRIVDVQPREYSGIEIITARIDD